MAFDVARFLCGPDEASQTWVVSAAVLLPSAEEFSLLRDDRPEGRSASVSLELPRALYVLQSVFVRSSSRVADDKQEARPACGVDPGLSLKTVRSFSVRPSAPAADERLVARLASVIVCLLSSSRLGASPLPRFTCSACNR